MDACVTQLGARNLASRWLNNDCPGLSVSASAARIETVKDQGRRGLSVLAEMLLAKRSRRYRYSEHSSMSMPMGKTRPLAPLDVTPPAATTGAVKWKGPAWRPLSGCLFPKAVKNRHGLFGQDGFNADSSRCAPVYCRDGQSVTAGPGSISLNNGGVRGRTEGRPPNCWARRQRQKGSHCSQDARLNVGSKIWSSGPSDGIQSAYSLRVPLAVPAVNPSALPQLSSEKFGGNSVPSSGASTGYPAAW